MKRKNAREMSKFLSFEERYEYLRLRGIVGDETFGYDRYLNQILYRTSRWKRVRNEVIIRDNGCDLGVSGYSIGGLIIVHHINPITLLDIEDGNENVFNAEELVCTSQRTHNAIHYGDKSLLLNSPIDRFPGDTTPWRKK